MKKLLLFYLFILLSHSVKSQATFGEAINVLTDSLAKKLIKLNKKKVLVLTVTDLNKAPTTIGTFFSEKISTNLLSGDDNFQVFDVSNLMGIPEGKKLIDAGYINDTITKRFGKLLAVDAIITGTYTILDSKINLSLKIINSETGFSVSSVSNYLPKDKDADALLGVASSSSDNNSNRGFNGTSVNSNEKYNNPETVSQECVKKNTGDYCFTNTKNVTLVLKINPFGYAGRGPITLEKGQTQCFYNLECIAWNYEIIEYTENGIGYSASGEILVEKCKSKTFTIK